MSDVHRLFVISHTHWDREWYLTFQQFRLRLVDLVDHVLALLESETAFRCFNLDAQTIVLEDYLQIRPQNRERLAAQIRAGRLTVGPWYQLNDQFLTSGEATLRSLLLGTRMAESFGASLKIGYLPDQFGNLSQMPQIFRGFGIDNAIVGRGYQLVGDRKMEFWWEGADGSRLLTSLMALWYNNAQRFPADTTDAAAYAERLRRAMAARSAVSSFLLMNGVDHLEAQANVGEILNAVNARWEQEDTPHRLHHATLTQYVDALRAEVEANAPPLETKTGELREDRGGACLAGTLSSRMYLKQANHHAQITLEHHAERLAAFARLTGVPYPYDQMHYAWKLLMQNHPHDSICGCSIDPVHTDMMPRFAQVEQVGEELIERALDALTERDRTHGAVEEARSLRVFNTLNWTRTDPVVTSLEFPLGVPARGNPPRDDRKQVTGFRLLDADGAEIPFAVTRIETTIRQVLNPHELPLDQWVQRFHIEFVAHDVPACGYKTYTVEPQAAFPTYPAHRDRSLGQGVYFYDGGEVGDEYLHKKPLRDRLFETVFSPFMPNEEANAVRESFFDRREFLIPASATPDGQGRSEEFVPCSLALHKQTWTGVPRTEFTVHVHNRSRDHRLRVTMMSSIEKSGVFYTEGQFDVVERPFPHPLEAEGALPFHPQQFWTAFTTYLRNSPQTMTLMNRGLPECEVAEGRIYLTLLRCVGELSRRGDGPQLLTPDAQCLGEHTFHFAVMSTNGDWKQEQVWRQAHQFNVPLRAVQCPFAETLPAVRSFVTVEPAELVVTAIKRAEDRETVVVRFYNITGETVETGRIEVPGATRLRRVTLNEEPEEAWRDGEVLTLSVPPKRIVTIEAELRR